MASPILNVVPIGQQGGFFSSSPNQIAQVSKFAPNQLQGQNQALQMALSGLQNPTAGFEPIAQKARTQFNTQTVPGLAERFTALGGGAGGQRSSAFQGALGQAGAGLEENLAALGSQYGLQQQELSQRLLGLGLQPQFENLSIPGQSAGWQRALGPLLQAVAAYFTGGASALPGLAAGAFGGGFGGGGGSDILESLGQQQAQPQYFPTQQQMPNFANPGFLPGAGLRSLTGAQNFGNDPYSNFANPGYLPQIGLQNILNNFA